MMLDGWGNREETHNFGICVWKNTRKMPQNYYFFWILMCAFFGIKFVTLSKCHSPLFKWLRFSRIKTNFKSTKNAPRIRKNLNFENRFSSCSNQAQMTPWAKISWSWDFWWLRKTDRQTYKPTDKIHVL